MPSKPAAKEPLPSMLVMLFNDEVLIWNKLVQSLPFSSFTVKLSPMASKDSVSKPLCTLNVPKKASRVITNCWLNCTPTCKFTEPEGVTTGILFM